MNIQQAQVNRTFRRAYDLNSVSGLVWSGGTIQQTGIRPANIALPADDANWFRFRIGDRRGNLSDTWMIPIPPETKKTKANLPAFETVPF